MNPDELEIHTHNYIRHRIIDDALVPYFDQRGKWVGDRILRPRYMMASAEIRMRHAFLQPSRRIRKSRVGTILCTSLVWREKTPLVSHFAAINGSLLVSANTEIEAVNLRHIRGHFVTESKERIQLPCLVEVGGNFESPASCNVQAPNLKRVGGFVRVYRWALTHLETVGGDYIIRWSHGVEVPHLVHVGGSFMPLKCTAIHAPRLVSVGKNLITGFTGRKLHLPMLQTIGGDFLVETVKEIHAPCLRHVGGEMNTASASDFYDSRIQFGKQWTFHPEAELKWLWRQAAREAIRWDPSIEI